jgi:hypothetical protein
LGLVATIAAALLLAVILWSQGGQDDKYITYWSALSLAERGEIVNYNGARLEQSSSLSFVVILALLHSLSPFSMPMVGYLASLAGAALTGLQVARLARRMGLPTPSGAAAATLTAPSFSYWATSGMEVPWFSFSALWLIGELAQEESRRRRFGELRIALAALLFAGIRPEAPFLLVGLCGVHVGMARLGGGDLGSATRRALIGVASVGAVLGFRKVYFDAWLPLPALVKIGGFDLLQGTVYLWDSTFEAGVLPLFLFVAGSVLVLISLVRHRCGEVAALVTAFGLGDLTFLVLSGGDWMRCSRFLAPAVPALVLTGFLALQAVTQRKLVFDVLVASYCVSNVLFSLQALRFGLSDGQPLWTAHGAVERVRAHIDEPAISDVELLSPLHRPDAVLIDELFAVADAIVDRGPDRRIRLLTGQAGMLIYHLAARHPGRFDVTDLWSLTDRRLLDCLRPESFETTQQGTMVGAHQVLQNHVDLTERCGLLPPDLYVNPIVDPYTRRVLERLDYEIVYQHQGWIGNDGRGFFPARHGAFGFIAVKRDLARMVGIRRRPAWEWNLDPP